MITDQAVTLLSNGQAMTIDELVAHLPDLAGQPNASEVLRLLLRLDRRFRENEGRWILRADVSDPAQRIRQAAQVYFQSHSRGELKKFLISAIAAQTGQPESEIETIISQTYRQVGPMILNQRKEHK